MANFAGESGVRAKSQLNDSTLVPSALVVSSIDDAHVEVLRLLDPVYDVGSPDDAVVLGETMLAGAHLLRSLASDEGFRQRHLQVGGAACWWGCSAGWVAGVGAGGGGAGVVDVGAVYVGFGFAGGGGGYAFDSGSWRGVGFGSDVGE